MRRVGFSPPSVTAGCTRWWAEAPLRARCGLLRTGKHGRLAEHVAASAYARQGWRRTASLRRAHHADGMPNYRRAWIPGGCYFFTLALADRHARTLAAYVDLLRAAVAQARKARPFRIDACVVLPDHLHMVWTLPPGDADYAVRIGHLKAVFSRGLARGERRNVSRRRRRELGVWQRRYWEHLIRDEADFAAHIDYVHFNPVKHRHVARVRDWEWSTFHRYVAAGVLTPDWGGCRQDEVRGGEP